MLVSSNSQSSLRNGKKELPPLRVNAKSQSQRIQAPNLLATTASEKSEKEKVDGRE